MAEYIVHITEADARSLISADPLSIQETDRRRWYSWCDVIAQHPVHGLILLRWMRPHTELQEDQEWFATDADGMVSVTLVEPYERTITAYRPRHTASTS